MAMNLKVWSKSHPWLPSFIVAIGGILFLLASRMLAPSAKFEPFGPSILRDLGIALVVGGVVTMIYESHARRRAESEAMHEVLKRVLGHDVGEDVWNGVREQVFERSRMTRNARIHIRLDPAEAVPSSGLYILHINLRYHLCGLRTRPQEHTIRHVLDRLFQIAEPPRPCFNRVQIDKDIYLGKELHECIEDGVFSKKVILPSQSETNNYLSVEIHREELIHIPGSYNFVFTELTQNIQVEVDGLTGLTRKIIVWAHSAGEPMFDASGEKSIAIPINRLFFPGEGISIRFQLDRGTAALDTGENPADEHATAPTPQA